MKVVAPVPPFDTGRVPVTSLARSTDAPRVEAIVMEPAPFETEMPAPWVRVARLYPEPLPMRREPFAAVAPLSPVPPYCAPIAEPCHVPEVIVPVAVIEERLPVVMTVPVAFGKVMVWSAVGFVTTSAVSKASSAPVPSKMIWFPVVTSK